MAEVVDRVPAERSFLFGALLVWLTLWLAAATLLASADVDAARLRADSEAEELAAVLNDRLIANDHVLRGFAALVGVLDIRNEDALRRYAAQVIAHAPQVFSLEIVQRIAHRERDDWARQMRRSTGRPFALKAFSYDERRWGELPEKPFYSPIVFMEPMLTGADDLLGLDLDSVPFLRESLIQAEAARQPVASTPFRLVQGNLAYVVFSPVEFRPGQGTSPVLYVDMVIDAERLLPEYYRRRLPQDRWTVTVHHEAFAPGDEQGHLVHLAGDAGSDLERRLFPAFASERALATLGGALRLEVRRQIGWGDLAFKPQLILFTIAMLSLFLLLKWHRARDRAEVVRAENEKELWRLANYDALTGVPNRRLLIDRLTQHLYRAERRGQHFAVMYLDLDRFKAVNDAHGHAVGDRLLQFVAGAVASVLRAGDTFGRLAGDEFLILLAEADEPLRVARIEERIRTALAPGLPLDNGIVLRPQVSLGVVEYPGDGETVEDLLRLADQRMYVAKRRSPGNGLAGSVVGDLAADQNGRGPNPA